MAKAFSRINGWPVAVGIVDSYLAMASAFKAQFGVDLVVTSGIRTYAEQEAIFRKRYTMSPGGRRVYDKRFWNGAWWYRIDPLGTVAQPGTSNHETGRSLDLADTGADAGVAASFYTARNQWLSANCGRWGFTHTGKNFAEPWHFEQLQVADPFLGRGKPNSISPDDPGEPIGGAAGGSGGSTTDNTLSEEDEIMRIKNVDTGRIYNVGMGSIVHVDGGDGENKAWHDAGLPGYTEVKEWSFQRIIRQMGIPKGVVNAKGSIRNDREGQGKYESNGSWFASDKAERFAYLAQK